MSLLLAAEHGLVPEEYLTEARVAWPAAGLISAARPAGPRSTSRPNSAPGWPASLLRANATV